MRETERESTTLVAESTPSLNLIFDLLSNRCRRYVLYYLYDQPDGVATIEDVADHVVVLEMQETGADTEVSADERTHDVRVELQHVHLPKLEDAGIIELDRRSETVRYWTQPSLEEWLEHAKHKELS
ncbi:DUF7344 domain-containing protein [Natrarchaeobaculum sulfurireducens]|uniref:DUF7344 domain-containing protein n=1 Tax=Natrarchaeobaculum sulfurireducens TaxID=2044521 RepID=A0A346PSQ3_9EURY|nr:hypothetical protein [Natrarchaeobaculum sulfurireducens]AXR82548.1 hypothetical protein AArcMg_2557 [Natrarchaeobaculum sulfurireducens]